MQSSRNYEQHVQMETMRNVWPDNSSFKENPLPSVEQSNNCSNLYKFTGDIATVESGQCSHSEDQGSQQTVTELRKCDLYCADKSDMQLCEKEGPNRRKDGLSDISVDSGYHSQNYRTQGVSSCEASRINNRKHFIDNSLFQRIRKLSTSGSNQPCNSSDSHVLPNPVKLPKESPRNETLTFAADVSIKRRPRKLSFPSCTSPSNVPKKRNSARSSNSGEYSPSPQELLLFQIGSNCYRNDLERIISPPNMLSANAARNCGVTKISENKRFLIYSRSPGFDKSTSYQIEQLDSDLAFRVLFALSTCYDIMPSNAKVVLVDNKLPIGKAFRALVENGTRAAPVWCSERETFVGLLTITEFMRLMDVYINTPGLTIEAIEAETVGKWFSLLNKGCEFMYSVHSEDTLATALAMLNDYDIHRLPVLDYRTGNVLHIVTHQRLLNYYWARQLSDLPQLSKIYTLTLEESGLLRYCYRNRHASGQNSSEMEFSEHVISSQTLLVDAMRLFLRTNLTALPVVNKTGQLEDILTKFDCMNLGYEPLKKNVNCTVEQILRLRRPHEICKVLTCTPNETLLEVVERFVKSGVRQLVVVNDENRLHNLAVLTLSRLLGFLMLEPIDPTMFHKDNVDAYGPNSRQPGPTDLSDESDRLAEIHEEVFSMDGV